MRDKAEREGDKIDQRRTWSPPILISLGNLEAVLSGVEQGVDGYYPQMTSS